ITAPISAGIALTLQGAGYAETGTGAIAAQTLTTGAGSLSGGLALGGSNTIGTLGALLAGGNVQLADTSPLAIAGLVSTPGTLIVTGNGAVNETAGGVLSLGGFGSGTGSIGGAVSLTNANNIGTLGALTATGNIVIDDAGTMTLGGAVSAGTSLALAANGLVAGGGSLSAGTIALAPYDNGTVDLGGTAITGLQISQSLVNELDPAAVVVLGSAAGHAASSILTEGAVSFANALAALDSTGGITQTGTLTGAVTGTTFDLNATSVALDGVVNATLLNLNASGAVTQASTSALNLSTLAGTGTTSGNIVLGGANNIGTLGALTATGNINLQDNAILNVKGAVSAAMITLSAAGLDLASQISASSLSVLDSSGSLNQSGGKLTVGTLSGSIANNASLNSTQNSIGTLANFTVGGTLNLTDRTALTLNGDITAKDTLAGALDLTSSGSLSQSGTLSGISISLSGTNLALDGTANATTLTLDATSSVSQAGTGVLSVATLSSNTTASGAILLGGTANAIGTLGSLAAGQNILIADAQTGAITAPISAGIALTLQGAGYAETGTGAIAAQTLTTGAGSLSGGLALGGSNT
ncbi:MAG: S-layer family protein, partial [Rhodospirillales bacterium]|nr:S-layer family protein [Rhodospirillales bacterium]